MLACVAPGAAAARGQEAPGGGEEGTHDPPREAGAPALGARPRSALRKLIRGGAGEGAGPGARREEGDRCGEGGAFGETAGAPPALQKEMRADAWMVAAEREGWAARTRAERERELNKNEGDRERGWMRTKAPRTRTSGSYNENE